MRICFAFQLILLAVLPGSLTAEPVVPVFVDETATSGISSIYDGEWEFMVGGGVAAFDCSGDLRPELFFAGGTAPASLWRNESSPGGALMFTQINAGVDFQQVTGAYPLDIDADGLIDLALLRVGENLLLRGLGDCRFERANEAWAFDGGDAWSTAFAATWEDGADWPTLAVGNYIDRNEDAFPWGSCTDNWLHRPSSDHGFAPPTPLTPSHCALSMLFTDWDRSGQPSLRVSNDREYYKGGQEQLWHFPPGGVPTLFTESEGWQRLRIWGMGIAAADVTGDGYQDYFLTSMADNRLQTLANAGEGTLQPIFSDIAYVRGVTAHRPYFGELLPSTAWHAQFEDVNNDARVDLFIVKGNVAEMPDFAQQDPNNLLLQRSDGSFEEAGDRAGVASLKIGRGGMITDLNQDGLLDMIVVNRWTGVEVWRNDSADAGNWIALRPTQPGPNRDAIGAFVEVRVGEQIQSRELTIGGGHASGHLGWLHFGLGAETAADVRVLWPDGRATDWTPTVANGWFWIDQDQGLVAAH